MCRISLQPRAGRGDWAQTTNSKPIHSSQNQKHRGKSIRVCLRASRASRNTTAIDRKNSEAAMEMGTSERPAIKARRSYPARGINRLRPGSLCACDRSLGGLSMTRVVFKAASIKLAHQIKTDEKSLGLIGCRVTEECRVRPGTLRDDGSRVV